MQKLGLTLELGLDKILYATYIVSKTYSDIKVKISDLEILLRGYGDSPELLNFKNNC